MFSHLICLTKPRFQTILNNNQKQGDYFWYLRNITGNSYLLHTNRNAELNRQLALVNSKFSGLWDDRDLAHLVLLISFNVSK